MVTTANLGITLVDQSQSQKEVTINDAFVKIDAFAALGKTGTATATSSTTLTDVAGMSVSLVAGGVYALRLCGMGTANVAAGFKIGSGGTATYTSFRSFARIDNNGAYVGGNEFSAPGTLASLTATSIFRFGIEGVMTVNAAGTFTVQFAQNVSNAAASSLTSCWVTLQRIA